MTDRDELEEAECGDGKGRDGTKSDAEEDKKVAAMRRGSPGREDEGEV